MSGCNDHFIHDLHSWYGIGGFVVDYGNSDSLTDKNQRAAKVFSPAGCAWGCVRACECNGGGECVLGEAQVQGNEFTV